MDLQDEIKLHLSNPNREEGEANLALLIAQTGREGQAALDAVMAERLDMSSVPFGWGGVRDVATA